MVLNEPHLALAKHTCRGMVAEELLAKGVKTTSAIKRSYCKADILLPPPDPPVCSVMQEQTGGSRLIADTDNLHSSCYKQTFVEMPSII